MGINVLEAAKNRISNIFDQFEDVCISFSGGKDSTVMTHLVMEEAIKRSRKVGLLFIDWECQFKLTIDHVRDIFDLYADHITPYWIALPLLTTNAVSQFEPEWICWEKGKEWVRSQDELPSYAITSCDYFDFYEEAMTFEEFVPAFGHWLAKHDYTGDGIGRLTASVVGIRTNESLNRFRSLVKHKNTFQDWQWSTWIGESTYNVYPIYDWSTEDIWTYLARYDKPYNKLYDRMHQAGLSIHQMRICEPFGDEQRKGLWLYHVIEPDTWGKLVARVNGANSGALYSGESGNVMGNVKVELPPGHTWKSFVMMLLDTMPQKTSDHYKDKIAVWMKWYKDRSMDIADYLPDDTGSQDRPSWRRVAKTLLKNDYWCSTLCFSPNKTSGYDAYRKLMKRRRTHWGIFSEENHEDN